MDWTSWGLVVVLSLASGAAGAFLYARRAALRQAAAPYRLRLERRLRRWRQPQKRQVAAPTPRPPADDDIVVLIPDGRPWPLGPALHLLELAWRWQVVHGANLPLRARQGEGAYVWRPPLPARNAAEQQGPEAERQR